MLLGIEINYYGILRDVAFGLRMEDFTAARGAVPLPSQAPRPLTPYTCIIGRNSAGKSTLMDALSFLSEAQRFGIREASVRHGRDGYVNLLTHGSLEPMHFRVLLHDAEADMLFNYELTLSSDQHMKPFCEAELLQSRPVDASAAAVLGLSGSYPSDSSLRTELVLQRGKGFAEGREGREEAQVTDLSLPALATYGRLAPYRDSRYVLDQMRHWYTCRFSEQQSDAEEAYRASRHQLQGSHGGHRHLAEDGSNLANVLAWLKSNDEKDYYRRLTRIKENLPPDYKVKDDLLNGRIENSEEKLFALLLLLEDPSPRPLLLLENPDSGLYYKAIEQLNGALRRYTLEHPESQVIITTHSVNFIDGFTPQEVWLMSRADENGQAQSRNLADLPYIDKLFTEGIGLGALWYAGHFDDPYGKTVE